MPGGDYVSPDEGITLSIRLIAIPPCLGERRVPFYSQRTRSSAALKLGTIKLCLNPEANEQSISGVVFKEVLIVR
jgi:hypothetical protein